MSFDLYFFCLGKSKKTLVQFRARNVLPMICSESFMVSCLKFKSVNHFEFIFVYGERICSNFIDLHAAIQFSPHYFLKKLSFPPCIVLLPLLTIN